MADRKLPFLDLRSLDDRDSVEAAIQRVLDRGCFVLGPEVEAFEAEFARASGARHAIGVGSGTDALAILLRAAGLGPGDEVITTAVSSPFTAVAIAMVGARIVFADIQPSGALIDPKQIEQAITPRTRAIVPVHLYGQPAAMQEIAAIGNRHGLAVVEDCAQAHLATDGPHPVGTIGIGGAFSFYPTKNLGALGDGGAVVTNDASLAERARRLRNGGQASAGRHLEAGMNSRLDELQAAVLRERLTRLPAWTAHRRRLARTYLTALDAGVVALPADEPGHVYHLFTVRSQRRDELRAHLRDHGIGTLVHYATPLPRQPAFASDAPYPHADRFCNEVFSLPINTALTEADALDICGVLNQFEWRARQER
jgi:dTDP-4-amino-4,6-dideoxygalactose transaminase